MNINDIAIVIPSLNPDEKFTRVVDGMHSVGFSRFILVDDGSDEEHKHYFHDAMKYPQTELIVHEKNIGKGQALKDAFSFVFEKLPEIEAVITIDGDGQHTPEDAYKLAERLIEKPCEVVFGCRNFNQKNVPTHNKLGNKITSVVFRLLFGMKLSDTQTGLRGIPRIYLKDFVEKVDGTRFEYESNMLLYMNEEKIRYSEVSIETLYIEDNKSSHFHPVKDSVRIYKPIIKKSKSLKYVLVSLTTTIIDLVLFTILNSVFGDVKVLWVQTFMTTGVARILSALCNYTLNKKLVFKNNDSVKTTGLKYLILAVCQYLASYGLCVFVFGILAKKGLVKFIRTIAKLCIDFCLFVISYQIQKHWVFRKK